MKNSLAHELRQIKFSKETEIIEDESVEHMQQVYLVKNYA